LTRGLALQIAAVLDVPEPLELQRVLAEVPNRCSGHPDRMEVHAVEVRLASGVDQGLVFLRDVGRVAESGV